MWLLKFNTVIVMFYFILAFVLLAIDQVTKHLTTIYLSVYESFSFIEGVLSFTHCHNTGGPWSLFDGVPVMFIIATFLIFIIEILYFVKHPLKHGLAKLSCTLINAGAIGNLIDRIFRGYVVDMIEVKFIDYPVFNFADCCIVVGAIIMCIYVIFIEGKDAQKSNEVESDGKYNNCL